MIVKILEEGGYQWALAGTSLSFKDEGIEFEEWWDKPRFDKMKLTCKGMSSNDGGHNKFLESMQVWIFIKAPRGWWQEYDTYRVGTSKNSSSTMHTIQKRLLTMDDFEQFTSESTVNVFNDILTDVTDNFTNTKRLKGGDIQKIKWNLPEGFLQSRIINTNYKVLRNMFNQRYNHNLYQWQIYIEEIRKQCKFPDYLPIIK